MRSILRLGAALLPVLVSGCTEDRPAYDPGVTSADFVEGITNPFFPLEPGSTWVYEARLEEGTERIEVRVVDESKRIIGVDATVVRDTVSIDGETIEDTYDWYAQDRDGNVWYLGESTEEYEGGQVVSTEGSLEWGIDGALPGIIMKGDPRPDGEPYFQEFYWVEAVDEAEVIALDRPVGTEAGNYSDTVTTREWTRLEPGFEEEAHYARDVGLVLKEVTKGSNRGQQEKLVSFSIP